MKVGYIQTSPEFGDKIRNFQQIEDLLKDKTADILVLPELFATGYTFVSKREVEELAETHDEDTFDFLSKISHQTGAIIIGGFAEKLNGKIYNSSLIVYEEQLIGTYQKIHLFNKEKKWFSPGVNPFPVFQVNEIIIGVMICFDWIFPESARSLALQDAEIIAHPANLVLPYCQDAMKTRCLENGVFAITANRIGMEKRGEDEFKFTGKSQITSSKGEILSQAPSNENFIEIVEINLKVAQNKQLNNFNHLLNDRRIDKYRLD